MKESISLEQYITDAERRIVPSSIQNGGKYILRMAGVDDANQGEITIHACNPLPNGDFIIDSTLHHSNGDTHVSDRVIRATGWIHLFASAGRENGIADPESDGFTTVPAAYLIDIPPENC